jgi:hypothetical protein
MNQRLAALLREWSLPALIVAAMVCAALGAARGPGERVDARALRAASALVDTVARRATPSPCPVTRPNGSTPPGELPSPLHHGDGGLWTALWPAGTVLIAPEQIQRDGTLTMKWPWWRGQRGALRITGRRLDATAAPLQSAIPEGYGETGFQATALIFPSEGCWEITGAVAGAALTFVVLVERADGNGSMAQSPSPSRQSCFLALFSIWSRGSGRRLRLCRDISPSSPADSAVPWCNRAQSSARSRARSAD